jgi:hypothetical protein
MIENELEHFEGAVAKAARKRNSRVVIHALDHGVGILALGVEVVESASCSRSIFATFFNSSILARMVSVG